MLSPSGWKSYSKSCIFETRAVLRPRPGGLANSGSERGGQLNLPDRGKDRRRLYQKVWNGSLNVGGAKRHSAD